LVEFTAQYAHSEASGPYLATGIKIGEVTQTQAIVWARNAAALTPE